MAVLGTDRRVIVLALARMMDALGNSFLIIVLPLFIASGRIPLDGLVDTSVLGILLSKELLIGLVLSMFGFLNSMGQPFVGRLSDRTGRRKVFILAGLALLGGASGAYAFADSYETVFVLRLLQGVGAALTIPATVALVNELSSAATRGGSFGVFNTFRLIGFGFGPLVAGALVDRGPYLTPYGTISGFDAAFAAAVLGAAVSFGLVTLFVSDPERLEADAGDEVSLSFTDTAGRRGRLDSVFVLGVATLFMATGIALFATLEGIINVRLDQGATLFGLEFAAVVIANIAFQTPVGRASDTYGRRPFLIAGFVILVPATLAQGIVTTPTLMVLARLAQGTAVAMVFAPGLALAGDLARTGQSGTQLSVLTMAFGLGVAIGPLASGFLVGFGFIYPFAFGAFLALVGLVLVYTQVEETVHLAGAAEPTPQD